MPSAPVTQLLVCCAGWCPTLPCPLFVRFRQVCCWLTQKSKVRALCTDALHEARTLCRRSNPIPDIAANVSLRPTNRLADGVGPTSYLVEGATFFFFSSCS